MRLSLLLLMGCVAGLLGCAQPEVAQLETRILENGEPNVITVQHCLIGFHGSLEGKTIRRSKEAAAELAAELLQKAQSGEDFDALVKAYTNDSPPGIYQMLNSGLPVDSRSGVFSRDGMVPAFGDVGFKLEVGEYGMSEFDPTTSPFGWHIIKRLK